MNQPVPNVAAADVERVVRRDFPPDEVAAVLAALETYGSKRWHNEVPRVRLAILKLAAGRQSGLRDALVSADRDFRDVLSAAEYPVYFQHVAPGGNDEAKRQSAIDADWQSYRQWFEGK
jgi:hypothetical protein